MREIIRRYKVTGDMKRDLTGLIWLLERSEISAERAIEEAQQMAIRNPEFWGDEVGRPDDDYFDDDDDDEDEDEAK